MHIGQALCIGCTKTGGELLPLIVLAVPGSGKLSVEGDITYQFLKSIEHVVGIFSQTNEFGILDKDVTICIPKPLDGTSAALPMYIALHSALTSTLVNQRIAFTGALSDTDEVRAVGGIIDKVAIARIGKMDGVVIPMQNLKEFPGYSESAPWGNLFLIPVTRLSEALAIALPSKR